MASSAGGEASGDDERRAFVEERRGGGAVGGEIGDGERGVGVLGSEDEIDARDSGVEVGGRLIEEFVEGRFDIGEVFAIAIGEKILESVEVGLNLGGDSGEEADERGLVEAVGGDATDVHRRHIGKDVGIGTEDLDKLSTFGRGVVIGAGDADDGVVVVERSRLLQDIGKEDHIEEQLRAFEDEIGREAGELESERETRDLFGERGERFVLGDAVETYIFADEEVEDEGGGVEGGGLVEEAVVDGKELGIGELGKIGGAYQRDVVAVDREREVAEALVADSEREERDIVDRSIEE